MTDTSSNGPKPNSTLFGRASRLVISSNSLDDVLQSILDEAMQLCGGVRGFLAIVDHDRGELDVRYTAGVGWSEEKRTNRLKISEETGRGITSRVAATGMPYRSGNVLEDPYYVMSFEDARSELAVPLVDSFQRIRGVMNIESLDYNAFDDRHVCAVAGLTDLATLAIILADHRARETALVQIGRELDDIADEDVIAQKVIDVAADALNFEDCSLFLMDKATGKLVLRASRGQLVKQVGKATYELGEGLTGWTVQQETSIRVAEPSSDPRWRGRFEEMPASEVGAFMAVPIHSREGIIGVIRVQRKKSPYKWFPNAFTEDDERILATIAAQVGVAIDNSRMVAQLLDAQRMAAWGEMSARSAHMIGNRVFAIKGDLNELEYLISELGTDAADAKELLNSTKKGIFLLEEILNEFREFVKATQLDLEEVDLNSLVREAADEGFPKRSLTQLHLDLTSDLPVIYADPKKLKRCFSELMENAVNFQPEGGDIWVTTSLPDDESKELLDSSQKSVEFVQVRFEDTGPGIDADEKARIFNPFYTSRAKGMGLGLSIVKGIIDAHKGCIYENGVPGKGARFTILLPYEKNDQ